MSGWVVLALVVVVALGGPSLLRADLVGHPWRLPILYTPAVGTCLIIAGTTVTAVSSCDEPHQAEVTRTWGPGQQVPGGSATAAVGVRPEPSTCLDARPAYLGSAATDTSGFWTLVAPTVAGRLIAAPTPSGTPDFPWQACVVGALDGRPYTGTLRGGFTGDRRPDSRFASCRGDRSRSAAGTWVTCDRHHTIEVLASYRTETVFDGSTFVGPPDTDVLAAACATLARSLTGAADPTYGGRLRVASEALLPEPVMVHRPGDTTFSGAGYAVVVKPWCFLELVGPGVLRSTVIGLGDGELPVD